MLRAVFVSLFLLATAAQADEDPYGDYCEFAPRMCAEFERRGWNLRPAFAALDAGFEDVTIDETFTGFLVQQEEEAILRFFDRYQRFVAPVGGGHHAFQFYLVSVIHQTPELFHAFGKLSDVEAAQFAPLLIGTPDITGAVSDAGYEFSGLIRTLALTPESMEARLKAHLSRIAGMRDSSPGFASFLKSLDYKDWRDFAREELASIEHAWSDRYVEYLSTRGDCNLQFNDQGDSG